jgi:tripartite-type tricarboxylate transporter receptor subunit TctC
MEKEAGTMTIRLTVLILLAAFGLFFPAEEEPWAAEKKFPVKPIQVIIPFQPGDTDNLLRPFLEKMPEFLGQPVNMVYKPGAAGSVGAGFVAASKPDGYLLVGSSHSSIVVVPLTHKDVGYTWKSFAPVCAMVEASSLLVVQSSSPWKTLKELIEDSKKSPGKVTYSSSGTFGSNHMIPEAMCKEAGIKWTYIPSQGSGPTITALLGGHVQVASTAIAPALPHLRAGALRVMAVYRPTRMKALPDAPSLKELGFSIHSSSPYGILAPKDTPKEVVEAIYLAAKKVADKYRDSISDRLDKIGAEIGLEGPEEYTAHLGRQYELFSGIYRIVKQ